MMGDDFETPGEEGGMSYSGFGDPFNPMISQQPPPPQQQPPSQQPQQQQSQSGTINMSQASSSNLCDAGGAFHYNLTEEMDTTTNGNSNLFFGMMQQQQQQMAMMSLHHDGVFNMLNSPTLAPSSYGGGGGGGAMGSSSSSSLLTAMSSPVMYSSQPLYNLDAHSISPRQQHYSQLQQQQQFEDQSLPELVAPAPARTPKTGYTTAVLVHDLLGDVDQHDTTTEESEGPTPGSHTSDAIDDLMVGGIGTIEGAPPAVTPAVSPVPESPETPLAPNISSSGSSSAASSPATTGDGSSAGAPNLKMCQVAGKWRYIASEAVDRVITEFRLLLGENRSEASAQQQEKYMKGMVKFYGIKTPQLKAMFTNFYLTNVASLTPQTQIYTSYKLLESDYSEEKAAGIMVLVKNLRFLSEGHLEDLAEIVDQHIHEWATCDSIAGKVLNQLVKRDMHTAEIIAGWKDACTTWRSRCSCVAFVKVAKHGKHNDMILDICSTCIRQSERFVQLGVGWLLRELSVANAPLVINFIKTNYTKFSREGLRYAIEKLDPSLRKDMLEFQRLTKPGVGSKSPSIEEQMQLLSMAAPTASTPSLDQPPSLSSSQSSIQLPLPPAPLPQPPQQQQSTVSSATMISASALTPPPPSTQTSSATTPSMPRRSHTPKASRVEKEGGAGPVRRSPSRNKTPSRSTSPAMLASILSGSAANNVNAANSATVKSDAAAIAAAVAAATQSANRAASPQPPTLLQQQQQQQSLLQQQQAPTGMTLLQYQQAMQQFPRGLPLPPGAQQRQQLVSSTNNNSNTGQLQANGNSTTQQTAQHLFSPTSTAAALAAQQMTRGLHPYQQKLAHELSVQQQIAAAHQQQFKQGRGTPVIPSIPTGGTLQQNLLLLQQQQLRFQQQMAALQARQQQQQQQQQGSPIPAAPITLSSLPTTTTQDQSTSSPLIPTGTTAANITNNTPH